MNVDERKNKLLEKEKELETAIKNLQTSTNALKAAMRQSKSEELKPCPFCGGKAGYHEKDGKYGAMCLTTPYCCYLTAGHTTKIDWRAADER